MKYTKNDIEEIKKILKEQITKSKFLLMGLQHHRTPAGAKWVQIWASPAAGEFFPVHKGMSALLGKRYDNNKGLTQVSCEGTAVANLSLELFGDFKKIKVDWRQ